ncbi:MAG: ABC transporter permease [Chitinophagaceae bacterium]
MIKNYFKIAWRNLVRNKTFSAINIAGLALGMACSLLIVLWVQDERNVDAFHKNGKQLYQVFERQYYDGKVEANYSTQGLLADELKKVIPEIEFACGMEAAAAPGTLSNFEAGNKISKMNGSFAGADFFRMFSYPVLLGSRETALTSIEAIAISRNMAVLFFGSPEQAIGKTIRYENKEELMVKAVFENPPASSSMQFDFIRSWSAYVQQNKWVHNWSNTSPVTYVQLRTMAEPRKVAAGIKDFIYRYQEKNKTIVTELDLQAYPSKYLYGNLKEGKIAGGRIEYVKLFSLVAIFILLIACINFMNLATARSAKRAKEVGLRKVIGAMRSSLMVQFMGEALLLTFFAIVIAVLTAFLLLPAFNSLTGKQLSIPVSQPLFWVALTGLLLFTGFVAGSYPALFLSSLKPVRVLKGGLQFGKGAVYFRKSLVVFQFALSVVLIVGMIVIYRQMDYIQKKNLGYDRENLVYLPVEGELVTKYKLFKEEAGKLPGIGSVSKMRNSPTDIEHHTNSIGWPGKDPNLTIPFADGVVAYDFVQTMKLQLQAGRDFSPNFGTDSTAFLINETAAKIMGFANPVGQPAEWGNRKGMIIGVLKDFHFNSMHQAIDPLILRLDENWGWGTILVRTQPGQTKQAIGSLENICKALNPAIPFTYRFSDEEYSRLYKNEAMVSKLSNYFAFLAIFISCLGLFGLATFTAAQRTKEIGVRKVLGASVPNIVAMFSGDFLKLVGIALLIAIPVAWHLMNLWLESFVYKISIDWWIFGIAGLITAGIALLTVSYQSITAAISNPIKSLRTE